MGCLFVLLRVGECRLAVLVAFELIAPIVAHGVGDLVGAEAGGQVGTLFRNGLGGHGNISQKSINRHIRGRVKLTIAVGLFVKAGNLCVNILTHSGEVNVGLAVQKSVQGHQSVLLHSVMFLSGLMGFPSL